METKTNNAFDPMIREVPPRSWKEWPDPVLRLKYLLSVYSVPQIAPLPEVVPWPHPVFSFFSFLKGSPSLVFWALEDKVELRFWKQKAKHYVSPSYILQTSSSWVPSDKLHKLMEERFIRLAENVKSHETWVISTELSFLSWYDTLEACS